MSARRVAVVACLAGLLLPAAAAACMWDYDTVRMERARFPDALELITGKFPRHSPEFYEWRVNDRLKRLAVDPGNVALLDDLAVGYDKLGRHADAIATAERTEKIRPGRYETAANLGTFHFHAGDPEAGLPHIARALAINPDAHFGREVTQKQLTEYVLSRRKPGRPALPLAETLYSGDTFAKFVRPPGGNPAANQDANAAAVRGVLGMMRFAKHDSPVLLEALGSLLHDDLHPESDAKQLAARAYLKASYEVRKGPARAAYRALAEDALDVQVLRGGDGRSPTLAQVEAEFQRELSEAAEWYADLRRRELEWVCTSPDPDAAFDTVYESAPAVSGMDVADPIDPRDKQKIKLAAAGACCVAAPLAALAGLLVRRRLKRRAA